ncbi:MAG TPA: hypothetical protein VMH22_10555 [bacterium]|nr:hypothetical protein [bacterium]
MKTDESKEPLCFTKREPCEPELSSKDPKKPYGTSTVTHVIREGRDTD